MPQLDDAGEHYSATERRADEASRSVTTWLKCHYMQQHLGEEFVGAISAVAEFGLFVTLKDLICRWHDPCQPVGR